ncbi:hypothetical protein BpHYR1_021991 [Brachionus plicatilis]|uniref:EGF-like domain-containing protein n=1 Tax=Brachionus plicatilis TaxID=10195 RepID=A0A3M7REX4_BRAPC|nr:hypothetical protein BpHYR1_021991 [Brachionus plicatilis]
MIEVEEIKQEIPELKKESYESNFRKHRFFVISYGTLGSLIIILGLIAIIITGAFPCLHSMCHPNATCYNKPFFADCVCNSGFSGNGRDHCDGKQ